MRRLESDPTLLPVARELAERAGLDAAEIRPLDRGLSSDLFTVHLHPTARPRAVVKLQRGFAAKVHAEAGALDFLAGLEVDGVPEVLSSEPDHQPPALVMSWLSSSQTTRSVELDPPSGGVRAELMGEFGEWLAELHALEVPPGEVKMSSDPLALPGRLLAQAGRAIGRFERRLGDQEPQTLALLRRAHTYMKGQVPELLSAGRPRRMIHRDLRPSNLLEGATTGDFAGAVDFEHAAAADPAWDFAKLRWWWFDRRPDLEAPFREGYESKRAWPDAEVRRLFRIFEATTLIAYFFGRHPVYPTQAVRQLRAELDGSTRPRWAVPTGD